MENVFSVTAIACVDGSCVVVDAVSGEIYGHIASLDKVDEVVKEGVQDEQARVNVAVLPLDADWPEPTQTQSVARATGNERRGESVADHK